GSATENREIGVLLEDRGIAQRFEAAFDADWEGRATSGTDAWRLEDPLALLGLYALVAVASAVSLRKLRPGDKGIKPRPRVRTRALFRAPLRRRRGEVRLLPPELVAEPRARDGGGTGARGGREETRGRGAAGQADLRAGHPRHGDVRCRDRDGGRVAAGGPERRARARVRGPRAPLARRGLRVPLSVHRRPPDGRVDPRSV